MTSLVDVRIVTLTLLCSTFWAVTAAADPTCVGGNVACVVAQETHEEVCSEEPPNEECTTYDKTTVGASFSGPFTGGSVTYEHVAFEEDDHFEAGECTTLDHSSTGESHHVQHNAHVLGFGGFGHADYYTAEGELDYADPCEENLTNGELTPGHYDYEVWSLYASQGVYAPFTFVWLSGYAQQVDAQHADDPEGDICQTYYGASLYLFTLPAGASHDSHETEAVC